MTTTTKTERPTTADEAEIRRMIGAWSRALEAKDADALVADYAADALLFDVKPPYRTEGPAAIRRLWADCLPYFPRAFRSEHRDLELTVGADVAFCHALHRIVPAGEAHPAGGMWMRVTACYRKVDGRWRVAHEHVSIPFDPRTDRVAHISDADATRDPTPAAT